MHARQLAKLAGEKRYLGKKCPKGHSGVRLTVSGQCVTCHREQVKEYPPKKKRIRSGEGAISKRRYYERNKALCILRAKDWSKANPKVVQANGARRRAAKKHRTPSWADKEEIRKIYVNTPKGMHVDHIVPLCGKNVSGLHVGYNLQYLTPQENYAKNNQHDC